MNKKNNRKLEKKSSRHNPPNIKNKIKALILVYKLYGTPIKVVNQETYFEIFKENNLSKCF